MRQGSSGGVQNGRPKAQESTSPARTDHLMGCLVKSKSDQPGEASRENQKRPQEFQGDMAALAKEDVKQINVSS